jgi:hypothetical protein
VEKDGGARFIAGSIPDVVLTDTTSNVPVWVDPRTPDTWVETVRRELTPVWSAAN